jgi:hypothetical protein
MRQTSTKTKKETTAGGYETLRAVDEDRENRRLRELLQRSVGAEKTPADLRARISRIIRQS